MFTQFPQVMMNEVNYRHDLYKQEAQRDSQVRQAKQSNKNRQQGRVKASSGIKNGRLSIQKGL